MKNAYNILIRTLEGKRQIGRPRHRWDDNIKMNQGNMIFEGMD
jgi:hypothetical protein